MAKKTKEQISEIKEEIDEKFQESQREKDSPKLDKKVREEYMTIYQKLKRFELLNKKKAKEKYTFKGLKEKEFKSLNGKTIVSDALSEESKVDKNSISLEMLNAQIDGYHKKVFLQEVEGLVNPAMKERLLQLCTYNRGLSRDLPGMALFYKSMNGEKNRVKAAMLMVSYGLDDKESIALMETYFGPIDSKVIEFVEAFKKQTEGLSLNEIVTFAKHNTRDSVITQLKTEATMQSIITGKDVNAIDSAVASYTNIPIEVVLKNKEERGLFGSILNEIIPRNFSKSVIESYKIINKEKLDREHTTIYGNVKNEMKTELAGKSKEEKMIILDKFRGRFADTYDATIALIEEELKAKNPFNSGTLTDPKEIEKARKLYNANIRNEAEKVFELRREELHSEYKKISILHARESDPVKRKEYEEQMTVIEKMETEFNRTQSSKRLKETRDARKEKIFTLIEQKRRVESQKEGLVKKLEELQQSNADPAEIEKCKHDIHVLDVVLSDIGPISEEDEASYDARQQEIQATGKFDFFKIRGVDDLRLLDQVDFDGCSQEEYSRMVRELNNRKKHYLKQIDIQTKKLNDLRKDPVANAAEIEEIENQITQYKNGIEIIDKYIGGINSFRRDLSRKTNEPTKEQNVKENAKVIDELFVDLLSEKTQIKCDQGISEISRRITLILKQVDDSEKLQIIKNYLSKISDFNERIDERYRAVKPEEYGTHDGRDEIAVIKVIKNAIDKVKQNLEKEKYKVETKIKTEEKSETSEQEGSKPATPEEKRQEREEKKKKSFNTMREETNKILKMNIRVDGFEEYTTSGEQATGIINKICEELSQLISKKAGFKLNEQEIIWCEDSFKSCELYLTSVDSFHLKGKGIQEAIKRLEELKIKFEQYKQNLKAGAEKGTEKKQSKETPAAIVSEEQTQAEPEQETARVGFVIAGEVDPVKAGEEIEKSPLPEPEGKTIEKQLQEERERIETESIEALANENKPD